MHREKELFAEKPHRTEGWGGFCFSKGGIFCRKTSVNPFLLTPQTPLVGQVYWTDADGRGMAT
jgi:hypothetical protein